MSLSAIAQEDTPLTTTGLVERIGTNGVIVVSGKAFVVSPETKVKIIEKKSSFTDIRLGARANVRYQREGRLNRAITIDIFRRPQDADSIVGKWQSDAQWLGFEKQIQANSAKIEDLDKELMILHNLLLAKQAAGQDRTKELAQKDGLERQKLTLEQRNKNWRVEQAKIRARYQTLDLQKGKQ